MRRVKYEQTQVIPIAGPRLLWSHLHRDTRAALKGKLDGLFGWPHTAEVFDSLAVDRQQALLLLLRRFQELNLWHAVRSITNVYGEAGVGIEFVSWPMLRATLERRQCFTRLLAGHRNNEGGFRERKKRRGPALHIVMVAQAKNDWAAHFDRYDPLWSILDLWRHLFREGWCRELPNWQQIGGPLTE
jgi:hypothetical protein